MKKLWFKRKTYGWGWTPSTWQGWGILFLYVLFLIQEFGRIDKLSHSGSDTLMAFSPSFIVVTIFLILVCYATGEEPRWQWGEVKSGKAKIAQVPASVVITPISPVIKFEDFAKVDLRVGQIISAERVAGSDKLLKLMLDEGLENKRQIIAGLGKSYEAGELVGEQVIFVANLEPRKLMGLESNGMIVAVGASGPKVVKPAESVANGARLS